MTPSELFPWLGGLGAGALLALVGSSLYLRARRRTASALLTDAELKVAALLKRASPPGRFTKQK